MRNVSRRLERLEERAAVASKKWIHTVRIRLVDPVKGCTGVTVMEAGKPTVVVPPTPEEVAQVRAGLEKRRAGRRELPNGMVRRGQFEVGQARKALGPTTGNL